MYPPDAVPATNAGLAALGGIALDAAGNLYISTSSTINGQILEVTADATIHVFAGNATAGPGYSGDGSSALGAQLSIPQGLAFDPAGNLYIADSGNFRVRKVDGNGVITTVTGGGTASLTLGDGGPALNGVLGPVDVAVDAAGNLYIADYSDSRVRRVDQSGKLSTVAGGGDYVALTLAGSIGDGGPATNALLAPYGPAAIAVDSAGNLYIADTLNDRIRKVVSGTITTVAGSGAGSYSRDGGPATQAGLNLPRGVAVDSAGNIYIADTGDNRIRMVTPDGTITTIAGNGQAGFSGDGGPAAATLDYPSRIAVGADGAIYVSDVVNDRVRKLTPQ